MSNIRKCPKCGHEVLVAERLARLDNGTDVGCNNHDTPVVMWPEGNDE